MMNAYFFKCHKIKMITLALCNIFEQIWYSESILCRIGRGGMVPKTVYYKKIKGEGGRHKLPILRLFPEISTL